MCHHVTVGVRGVGMGRLRVAPDALAVAVDRLVAIVRVAADGAVTVRDLANGSLLVVSSELSASTGKDTIQKLMA